MPEGAQLWVVDESQYICREKGQWVNACCKCANGGNIAVPKGGEIVDVEARKAVEAIILLLSPV